jgi:hypothetical protein
MTESGLHHSFAGALLSLRSPVHGDSNAIGILMGGRVLNGQRQLLRASYFNETFGSGTKSLRLFTIACRRRAAIALAIVLNFTTTT